MDLNVLLVDDDVALGAALTRLLSDKPYHLSAVASGEEALKAMEACQADLVVSDEQMPGMSGLELLVQITERWPSTATMMLTGHVTAGTLVHAINRGRIVCCLLKPCQATEVDGAIRAALAWKLRRDRCDAVLPILRKQRDLLAAVDRAQPGLLAHLEANPGANIVPTAPYR